MTTPDGQRVRLKDGRGIWIRHGQAGDEAGIARVLVVGFPVYTAAARGNSEQAAACLVHEFRAEQFVVAVARENGQVVGATLIRDRCTPRPRGLDLIKMKLRVWGLQGLVRFLWAGLWSALLRLALRIGPGELYKGMAAVDSRYQSQGVASRIADFIEAYAAQRGYHTIWSLHEADNEPVLAIQRKRGCTLTYLPPKPLARVLNWPATVKSAKSVTVSPMQKGNEG